MKKIYNFLIIEKKDDIYVIYPSAELQDDLGTAGYLEYENKNKIKKGEIILKVEASKAILNLKSPISGNIVEINKKAIENPSLINSYKIEDNWIIKLKDVDKKEFEQLEDY
ncbi:glycine cleavage system protein H [[Mycoplasma] collis]|uniref:glycine cleavage system protein H n=1 Tax=[Mycoplasma] collis TaxID=2127 RepID=UPI00051C9867|nr:biotin/lipoyl-containing protein [[Mycoplasma] collis]